MREMNVSEYDESQYFKKEIEPRLNEIKRLCNHNNIPFFATACFKQTKTEGVHKTVLLSPDLLNLRMHDKKFVELVKVMNGFTTEVAREMEEINFS